MTVTLTRLNEAFHFEARNADGLTATVDGSPAIGGVNGGMRPMEMVLSAVGSCSAIDVLLLLDKQRQVVDDLKITVTGERREEVPRIFTAIHVQYDFVGELNDKKVERACRLSMEKLCSVSLMLKAGGVVVDWGYKVATSA